MYCIGACLGFPDVCLITEYVTNGNLHNFLLSEKHPYRRKLEMAIDAAKGNNNSSICHVYININYFLFKKNK